MKREEKRNTRIQIHNLVESNCKGCEYHHTLNSHEHCHTECPVGKTLNVLSNKLDEDKRPPKKSDKGEFTELKRGTWTADEEMYLINHYPYFKILHIAMRLNRSPKAVSVKLHTLKKKQKQGVC